MTTTARHPLQWAALVTVALAVLMMGLAWKSYPITAGDMVPTLFIGDRVVVRQWRRHPRRGEIVAYRVGKGTFLQRVVAVAGDTVALREHQLRVNGLSLPRSEAQPDCGYSDWDHATSQWVVRACDKYAEELDHRRYAVIYDRERAAPSFGPVTVPKDAIYVLGDNRGHAIEDAGGLVALDHVTGTASSSYSLVPHDGRRVRSLE